MTITPRAFIIRHGETEWSLNGRHTGTTELPLTSNGERRVRATGKALLGDDRLIVPRKLAHIYVSPRHRARRTLELLDVGCREKMPWLQGIGDLEDRARGEAVDEHAHDQHHHHDEEEGSAGREGGFIVRCDAKVQVTQDIREWDYGDYEGLTSAQIREKRRRSGEAEGGGREWDIWRDGCPGGESPADVTTRLDRLIADIRTNFHKEAIGKPEDDKGAQKSDVLLVAHGHILRAFAMRWIRRDLGEGVSLLLEAGGVGTLSYEHHNIDEPAILLGGAFMVDLVEKTK
ncbi:MAG: hypothetical protein Q9163_001085 [Psora crenata]